MENNNTHELEELLNAVIPIKVYRGVITEKLVGGYRVLGKIVTSPFEVDMVIDESLKNLENSLK